MTTEERAEVRQMLTDVLRGHHEEMKGRLNVIQANLLRVEAQTTKTNGRVTIVEDKIEILEKEEIKHSVNCPNESRIKTLEEAEISRKAIIRFVVGGSALAGTIGALLAVIVNWLSKQQTG